MDGTFSLGRHERGTTRAAGLRRVRGVFRGVRTSGVLQVSGELLHVGHGDRRPSGCPGEARGDLCGFETSSPFSSAAVVPSREKQQRGAHGGRGAQALSGGC